MRLTRIAAVVLIGCLLLSSACITTPHHTKFYYLHTSVVGEGRISSASPSYIENVQALITAYPAKGWEFDHWGGDIPSDKNIVGSTIFGTMTSINMTEDKTVVAYFKPEFTTYTDNTSSFTISVRNSWNVTRTGNWTLFPSPSLCAGVIPLAGVTTIDTNYTSLQTYYSEVFKLAMEAEDGYKFISEENLTIDGSPAIKVIYTVVYYGNTAQKMSCILLNQQRVWLITEICAPTCWNAYADTTSLNTYKDVFNTMLSSFHVLD